LEQSKVTKYDQIQEGLLSLGLEQKFESPEHIIKIIGWSTVHLKSDV